MYLFAKIIFVLLFILIIYMVHCGAVYKSRKIVNSGSLFNDIQIIDIKPVPITESIINPAVGKYVNITGWKAGRTINTQNCIKHYPEVIEYYKSLVPYLSSVIGENVLTTPLDLPTSCAFLIYENEGDFINWHYDVNYYNGRFFTLLLPITLEKTKYVYMNKEDKAESIEFTRLDQGILFEGAYVFHMATPLGKNEKRIILSLQYSTDPTINIYNRILMGIKDFAYNGLPFA